MKTEMSLASHKGCAKDVYEDFGMIWPEEGIAIVADGVGGELGGDTASRLAVKQFHAGLVELGHLQIDLQEQVRRIFKSVHHMLRDVGTDNPSLQGMATTLSLVWVKDADAYISHVGDSRVYLLREGELKVLTQDHARAEDGALTQALGPRMPIDPSWATIPLQDGDMFIIHSDGIIENLTEQDLTDFLLASGRDIEGAGQSILSEALRRNTSDDMTIAIVRVEATESDQKSSSVRSFKLMYWLPFLVITLYGVYWVVTRQQHPQPLVEVNSIEPISTVVSEALSAPLLIEPTVVQVVAVPSAVPAGMEVSMVTPELDLAGVSLNTLTNTEVVAVSSGTDTPTLIATVSRVYSADVPIEIAMTPTSTPTETMTPTQPPTNTYTMTPSLTPSPTPTSMPTETMTPTPTNTATMTPLPDVGDYRGMVLSLLRELSRVYRDADRERAQKIFVRVPVEVSQAIDASSRGSSSYTGFQLETGSEQLVGDVRVAFVFTFSMRYGGNTRQYRVRAEAIERDQSLVFENYQFQ